MRAKTKKLIEQVSTYLAVAMFMLIPNAVGAQAPSKYVNSVSDSLFDEILSIAPRLVLVVVGWCLIMYFIVGDDHKKSKYRGSAFVALITYLVLLVLDPLVGWFQGLL